MPKICAILGCRSKSSTKDVHFFSIPTVRKREGEETEKLCQRRRLQWINAINRKGLTTVTASRHHLVCSKHFLSGKPAYMHDEKNPDWAPNVNLGSEGNKSSAVLKYQKMWEEKQKAEGLAHPVGPCAGEVVVSSTDGCDEIKSQDSVSIPHEMRIEVGAQKLQEEPIVQEELGLNLLFATIRPMSSQAVSVLLHDYVGPVDTQGLFLTSVNEMVQTESKPTRSVSQQTDVIMSIILIQDEMEAGGIPCLEQKPGDSGLMDGLEMSHVNYKSDDIGCCEVTMEKATSTEPIVTMETQTVLQNVHSKLTTKPGLIVKSLDPPPPISQSLDCALNTGEGEEVEKAKFVYELCGGCFASEHDLRVCKEIPQEFEELVCKACQKLFFQHSLVIMQTVIDPVPSLISLSETAVGAQEVSTIMRVSQVPSSTESHQISFMSWAMLRKRTELEKKIKHMCNIIKISESAKNIEDVNWPNSWDEPDMQKWRANRKKHQEFVDKINSIDLVRDADNELMSFIDGDSGKPIYFCKLCKKSVLTKDKLLEHRSSHTSSSHKCVFCQQGFLTMEEAINHVDLTHTQRLLVQKINTCCVCGHVASGPRHMERHMRTHTGEKPFECDKCKAVFSSKTGLKFHVERHTTDSLFMCHTCEKSFTSVYYLKKHMKTHLGLKPHTCSVCDQKFTQKCSLQVHMRLHTGEKPYECPICGAKFCSPASKRSHVLAHSKKGSFGCKGCSMTFNSNRSLCVHQKVCGHVKAHINETVFT